MSLVRYNILGGECVTACPMLRPHMVGSMNCSKCEFYKGRVLHESAIYCETAYEQFNGERRDSV